MQSGTFPRNSAAFTPLGFADRHWILIVDSPYQEVTAASSRSLHKALLLLGATLLAFAAGSTLVYRNNHKKAKAEAESHLWREKRALEDKVRESEERYRTIVETTHDIIWTLNTQGTFTFINSSGEQISGYKTGELLGTSFIPLIHPEDLPMMQELFREALSGRPQTYQIRCRNKEGRSIVLSASSVPLYEGEHIVGTVSVGRDITERQKAELALSETQQKYQALVNSIDGIVWEAESDSYRYTFVSKPAERILGYPLHRWLAEPAFWFEHLHPDDRAEVKAHRDRNRGREHILEYRMLTADGRTVWFRDAARITVEDGRPGKMRGIMVDVSERRRAEEVLSESEERFRKIFEEGPFGMAVVDLDYRFVKANAMLCRMLDYTESEIIGLTFMNITHPDELGTDVAQVQKLQQGEISTYKREKRYLKKEGEVLWGSLTLSVVRDEKGEPRYFLSMIEDISERKRSEEVLARTEAQLRQSQKIEAVGKLAGGVAHDFNNLLTVINGYSEIALLGMDEADPLHASLTEIKKAGGRAAALTSQLLAFARKQMLQPRVLDLNAVVTEMNRMLRRVIGEDIELITRLDPNLGYFKGDPGQIEQVILNLAVNARDAMPAGGKMIITTQNVVFDCAQACPQEGMPAGSYVRLEVIDAGCGMDAETLSHLFEPFFTTKMTGTGTGLGLSTVYGIISQSSGYISVSSEPGKGSTFHVYMPRIEAKADSPDRREYSSAGQASSCRETILLVEDEEVVRALTLKLLKSKGYEVLPAADGAEALSICERLTGAIHLLLTDLVLPKINGRELAEKLTALRPSMKVIYMSGYTEDKVVRQGLSARSTPFLQKPFTAHALAQLVRQVLDGQEWVASEK